MPFGDFCAYDHDIPYDSIVEELKLLKDNLKALEKEIVVKNNEIKEVILRLENSVQSMIPPVSKISNAPFTQPQSLLSTTLSTHTLVTTDTPSSTICSLDELIFPSLMASLVLHPHMKLNAKIVVKTLKPRTC